MGESNIQQHLMMPGGATVQSKLGRQSLYLELVAVCVL